MTCNVKFRVRDEVAAAFDRVFPAYGSRQWFFEACMESVVELAEKGEIELPESAIDRVVREADRRMPKRF